MQHPLRFQPKAWSVLFVLGLVLVALPVVAAQKVPITFNDYHGYTATVKYLSDVSRAYPAITELIEIGKSSAGRPLFVLVISNMKTGTTIDAHIPLTHPRADGVNNVTPQKPYVGKPGVWLSAALRGDEISGVEACLYMIDKLVSGYGVDKEITALVDGKTFYFCPIINPDGVFSSVEKNIPLATNAPVKGDTAGEVGPRDLNGDGYITQFRYPDPQGDSVIDEKEPRVMTRFDPKEGSGKKRYSVITEGLGKGDENKGAEASKGTDLVHNFPEAWWTEDSTPAGSGKYPTCAPEIHAVVEFIETHPNILMADSLGGPGGGVNRPMASAADGSLDARDIAVFDRIMGKKYLEIQGEEIPEAWKETGSLDKYKEELRKNAKNKPAAERGYEFPKAWRSAYDEVKDRGTGNGVDIDWMYKQLGIYAISAKLWNPKKDIKGLPQGTTDEGRMADMKALLKVQDEKYGGKFFIPWQKFTHPTLGQGEIGGWIPKYTHNAFPGEPLLFVSEKIWQFERYRAGLLPDLVITEAKAKVLYTAASANAAKASESSDTVTITKGKSLGAYRVVEVTAVIENRGSLATHTAKGHKLRGNREDVVWLVGDRGKMRFLQGTPWQKLGVIDGAMAVPGVAPRDAGKVEEKPAPSPYDDDERKLEPNAVRSGGSKREVRWVVGLDGDVPLQVIVSSQKGGTALADVKVQ